jgi:hypothetical protein
MGSTAPTQDQQTDYGKIGWWSIMYRKTANLSGCDAVTTFPDQTMLAIALVQIAPSKQKWVVLACTVTKPIPDKAEVALELPDKLYIGTFERSSRFDAHLDQTGVSLTLHRTGDADVRKSVHMHFHYGLFADILNDLATTVASMPPDDANHREALRTAAKALYAALSTESAN